MSRPEFDGVDIGLAGHGCAPATERHRKPSDDASAVCANTLDCAGELILASITDHLLGTSAINAGAIMGSGQIELPGTEQRKAVARSADLCLSGRHP